ncbi:hypothetical protein RB608_08105 [Nocardioides sp. LHD-245]|uniref:hypothetical protein n=1 Tax=Nocardioides sp. LHD-245 TaxID=3051387 RepID=UPI0027E1C8C0|nr:hypothetical protein [Nocardioides sp. LHD-245]
MSTTRPAVTALRPRSLARRSATLREHVRARRVIGLPHEELLLDVLDGALARTHRVRPEDLDVWARLVALVEEHPELSHTLPACAASANLVGLALLGDVEDHAALSGLVGELGHKRLARLQHRYGTALETDSRLPVTSAALRRILAPGLTRRLAAHPRTAHRSETIDDTCLRAAHALLLQGVNRTWTVPRLDSVEEFADIAAHGTINEWRHHVAMIIADPWSPYVDRIVDLARQVGRSHPSRIITAIVALCREQELATGALAVPPTPHPATRRSRHLGARAAP